MEERQQNDVNEFNRLYKEMDDLYHDIALKLGLSDSALTIFYAICELGDGCLQKDICGQASPSAASRPSTRQSASWSGREPCT